MKAAAFWRSDAFAGLAILVLAVVVQLSTDFIGTLERRFYDLASTSTAHLPSPRIAIIGIDDQSIAHIGHWPWPRDVHARLIDQLTAAKAKTVVYTTLFSEAQQDPGLAFIRKIKEVLDNSAAAGNASADQAALNALVAQAQTALDTDTVLAASNRPVALARVFEEVAAAVAYRTW